MQDPFVGTWKLNPARSQFDPNHRPTAGTMTLEVDASGQYLMRAEGLDSKGARVTERPQTFTPDGVARPLPDFPGLAVVASRPQPNTIQARVTREDGSVVGEGSYVVSADGQSMTATTAGFDTQLRRFEAQTAWDRS